MKFAYIHLERFGARSQIQLDDLSQQLNVVYGPNGSGKSTIINFVRWLLHGDQDESIRGYLAPSEVPAGGSIKILDGDHRWRVVTRRDDGSSCGRLTVSRPAGEVGEDYYPVHLTGVDVHEYQLIFSFGFEQVPPLEQLVRAAAARGFTLTHDELADRQTHDLASRLADLRRTYLTLAEAEQSVTALRERQRQLQAEIDQADDQRRRRLRDVEREQAGLEEALAVRRSRLADLESLLHRIDDRIQIRRQQLCEARQARSKSCEATRQSEHHQIHELDRQIEGWRATWSEIRTRLDWLDGQIAQCQPGAQSTLWLETDVNEADLSSFLERLGSQIEDLESDGRDADLWDMSFDRAEVDRADADLAEVDRAEVDRAEYADYVRSVLTATLQSVRKHLHRIHAEVQHHKSTAAYHEHASERSRLRRCEADLADLIDQLEQRRDLLLRSGWSSPGAGALPHTAPWTQGSLPGHAEQTFASPWNADSPAVSAWDQDDPVLEAHLAHLSKRQERIAGRVRDLQADISATEHRMNALNGRHAVDHDERQSQRLRDELSTVRHRLRQVEDRIRCRDEIEALEREIERRKAMSGPSEILRDASSWLDRMTGRAYRTIEINQYHEIWLEDADRRRVAARELSRGTLDQVYLSLSLALVAAYYRRGVELPLILNDVFINIDAERAHATASVLEEFAARGHQTIVFTRHEHVLQLFPNSRGRRFKLQRRSAPRGESIAELSGPARYLDQVSARTAGYQEPPHVAPDERRRDWVAHWDYPQRGRSEIHSTSGRQHGYGLNDDTPLTEVECLDEQIVARLREIDVHTVRGLLDLDPEFGEQQFASCGITGAKIHRWQAEIMLQAYVGLTANDAGLLVACGVDDPEELAYMDVSELHRRIEQFLSNEQHRSRFGAISRYERSRLSRWIQAARQSRFRKGQRRLIQRGTRMPMRPIVPPVEETSPLETSPLETLPVESLPVESPPSSQGGSSASPADRELSLRFFLEPTDPVVDAPSIGPKTAERLNAAGVVTVADLLDCIPEEVAEAINYRRISASLIREWQVQTNLVCRVPNLRGHDAQILAACGVSSADQLAHSTPEQLHAKLKRFVRTNEGKRILRNGRKPDLAEVTAWIQWAENARRLQPAPVEGQSTVDGNSKG